MYTRLADPTGVRDRRARYGERPGPAEGFHGEGVLDDLPDAADADIPLIAARYVTLRAYQLRRAGAPAAVVRHAVAAADRHLDAVPASWLERPLLQALLRPDRSWRMSGLLDRAAALARSSGHQSGARALEKAAHRIRWETIPSVRPSRS